jgi:Leucine-rich repeat (LRR) protein
VASLDLSSLGLVGSLPSSLSWVPSLKSLKLSTNAFTGPLPPAWSALNKLTLLNLGTNRLTGTLPAAWSALSLLSQLLLGYNALSQSLPPSWALPAGMSSLTRLVASSNAALCGPLPGSWTSSLVSLTGTALGSACPVPPQTSGLLSLRAAVTAASWLPGAGWTAMTEPCATGWTGVSCSGTTVTGLDLGYYDLAGTLPSGLSLLTGLQSLSLGGNR